MLHKKAQIGQTLTWVLATIVIIVILVFSIYVSGILAGKNEIPAKISGKNLKARLGRDLMNAKTSSGYLLTKDDSGKMVFEQMFEEGDLNDFNGQLGVAIFKNYEKENYQKVKHYEDYEGKYIKGIWLRFQTEPVSVGEWQPVFTESIQQNYFYYDAPSNAIKEEFWLGEDKYAVFYFG